MANEIKSKITLDGEKQYSQALKDAQRNLKTLRSELKAETAELGANATQSQKAEAKIKSLKQQIAEQEKIVQTYRDALAEVREKYADNEDEIARWEQRLNSARASLAGMQNEMAGLSGGIAQVGATMQSSATEAAAGTVATKSFADAIEKIGTAGGSVSSAIEGIFTGMVSHVRDAISQIWSQVTELAGRANDWADLGAIWNTDASTIQQWYHAVRATANDFDDLNNAVTKIVMGDQKKIAEATGVSLVNYTDKWQGAMAVMDSLSKMGYEERLGALETIFGDKRAGNVTKLLDAWGEIQEKQDEFDPSKGGFGMTEEQLKTMDEVAKQVADIQEKWQSLKDYVNEGLWGKLTLDLGGNVEGALDALNLFFKAETQEERDKALDDFKKQLTEFFRKLGEAIKEAAQALDEIGTDLQGSEDGTLRTIGKIVSALSDLLEWLGNPDSVGQIVAGLETLAGFWLVGKGVKMASTIASIVKNIDVIRNFKAPDLSNPTAPTGGGKPVLDGGGNQVTDTVTKGGLWTAIANGATKFASGATSLFVQTGGMLPALGDRFMNETNTGRALRDGQNVLEGLSQDFEEKKAEVEQNASTFADDWRNLFHQAWQNNVAFWNQMFYGNPYGPGGGQQPQASAAPAAPAAGGTPSVAGFNNGQRQAAESYWDAVRGYANNPNANTEMDLLNASTELSMALGNSSEMFDSLDALIDELQKSRPEDWSSMEDLPTSWWRNQETSNTQTNNTLNGLNGTMSGLPAQIGQEIRAGMGGIRVYMDGSEVGRLTAPYVDQYLGANAPVTFGP